MSFGFNLCCSINEITGHSKCLQADHRRSGAVAAKTSKATTGTLNAPTRRGEATRFVSSFQSESKLPGPHTPSFWGRPYEHSHKVVGVFAEASPGDFDPSSVRVKDPLKAETI